MKKVKVTESPLLELVKGGNRAGKSDFVAKWLEDKVRPYRWYHTLWHRFRVWLMNVRRAPCYLAPMWFRTLFVKLVVRRLPRGPRVWLCRKVYGGPYWAWHSHGSTLPVRCAVCYETNDNLELEVDDGQIP